MKEWKNPLNGSKFIKKVRVRRIIVKHETKLKKLDDDVWQSLEIKKIGYLIFKRKIERWERKRKSIDVVS